MNNYLFTMNCNFLKQNNDQLLAEFSYYNFENKIFNKILVLSSFLPKVTFSPAWAKEEEKTVTRQDVSPSLPAVEKRKKGPGNRKVPILKTLTP